MNSSIKLHKEHGLNPTLSQCILCGEETGEIALLGGNYKEKAPMRMITSIEPCDKCKKKYLSDGVMLVEAEEEYDWNKKLRTKPTGKVAVIKQSAFEKLFNQKSIKKVAFVEVGLLDKLGIK
jgi:deoxycytidylate deaminase